MRLQRTVLTLVAAAVVAELTGLSANALYRGLTGSF